MNKRKYTKHNMPVLLQMEIGRKYFIGELIQLTGRNHANLFQILGRYIREGLIIKEGNLKYYRYTRIS